jgi:hypothetical protein
MKRPMLAVLLLASTALAGCETTPSPPSAISESVMPTLEPAPPTADEMEAIRFRTEFALRADIGFVRAVAQDPSASTDFGVPLLPTEIAALLARGTNAEAVADAVAGEAAAHPEDYCGRYIDHQNGGAFTSMWRAHLPIHSGAILLKAGPTANVAFRACTFSETELNRVMDQLNAADHDWMGVIPARISGYGTETSDNRIAMNISSAVGDAAERVDQHYTALLGLPPGLLFVRSDGNGAGLRPWGTLVITVLNPDGRPVGPNSLSLRWEGRPSNMSCGVGDVGYGVSADGTPTELPCQEGHWLISVWGLPDFEKDEVQFGSAKVDAQGDAATALEIRLHVKAPAPLT